MEGKQYKAIPYLARRYPMADDLCLYSESDYFNDDIITNLQRGDAPVTPLKTTDNPKKIPHHEVSRYPATIFLSSYYNQIRQDNGIVYERHSKGIPMLQICDVKLQYGLEEHVKYSWKLNEVTEKECKLEIDRSDKNERGKKIVKFCFATNDTDKLLSHIVDGYEVKYMVRTDAIRLRIELEIVLSSALPVLDFNSVHREIKLEIERDGNPYSINLLADQRPTKKPKLDQSSENFELSITLNVPRNLRTLMQLAVILKDSSGTLDVDDFHRIFSYNIPVDQEDYFYFKNGHIKSNVLWGCCFSDGKGLCTGVCTCEPVDFIGFCSPGEVSCSKDAEE